MADTLLSTKNIGSIIKIKENGSLTNFIVLKHGYPNSGNGRTLLVREGIYDQRQWNSTYANTYENCATDLWLNSGYFNLIDAEIRNHIINVNISFTPGHYNNTVSTLNRKVFLLSSTEVGCSGAGINTEGNRLDFFSSNTSRIAKLNGNPRAWGTRSPDISDNYKVWWIFADGNTLSIESQQNSGTRPAFTVASNLLISDDGTVKANVAPSAPSSITVPTTVIGGNTLMVSWGTATDTDNNLFGYILERSINSGSNYSQIYKGTNLSHIDTITKGWPTVTYRVKAYDSYNLESGYNTSTTRAVDNNTAPVINCSSPGELGNKDSGFSITYSITDAEGDVVTVKEELDGAVKRTFTAVLGTNNIFD